MANVELVIKIPEHYYEIVQNSEKYIDEVARVCEDAVRNGTPIPKGRRDSVIPYMLHKELNCPLDECIKAYDKMIEYLRNKARVKG